MCVRLDACPSGPSFKISQQASFTEELGAFQLAASVLSPGG